jgi:hypothetical protein
MSVNEKRNFRRVTTLLPFEARRLDPKGHENLKCQVSNNTIVIDDLTPPQVEDEKLSRWLNMLNTKLDYLISLSPPTQEDVIFMAFELLNISGSGMSLITKESLNIGDILEIKIVIQTYPSKILHLYGKIIRIDETPNRPDTHTLGVNFLDMNEEVRNEITKFDFKKHKERLLIGNKRLFI